MATQGGSRTGGKQATGGELAGAGDPAPILLRDLLFDPDNPRTVERLGPDANQQAIEQFLLAGEMKARELIPSFTANGFIPYEPLIVRPKKRGKHIVVEGNRRLAALHAMRDSDDPDERSAFQKHSLSSVPCLVFQGTERELLAYLGLRHLSKTKDWTTAAKGAFVERILRAQENEDPADRIREAGRLTNTSTGGLRLILLTRRLFERSERLGIPLPTASADGETTFWHLGDAVRRSNTKAYLELEEHPDPLLPPSLNENRFEKLVGWVYGNPKTGMRPVISSIRDIPELNRCLGDARGIDSLESGDSLKEAVEAIEAAGATVVGHIDRAKKSVQRAMPALSEVSVDGMRDVETAREALQNAIVQLDAAISARRSSLSTQGA